MISFLKRLGFICIALILFVQIISFGSLWALRQGSFYKPSYLTNTVEEQNFDYIIVGASTGLTTLNTLVIDSVLGTNGLNLAMDDTTISSQYLMLQHFLASGKSTKTCILAPSVMSYDYNNYDINNNDYRFLMYVNKSYVSQYYNEFRGTKAKLLGFSEWLPAIGVTYYNMEIFYPGLLSLLEPNRRNRFDYKGNYTYPKIVNSNEKINAFTNLPIHFTNLYINRIKKLCELHNIKFICYFTPMRGQRALIKSKNYNIINHSDLLQNKSYFHDDIHVNSQGRKAASLKFSDDLYKVLFNIK